MKRQAVRYLVAIVLSGGALYFAFRKQNLNDLLNEIEQVNILFILGGTAVMFLSHLVRAWRFKMFFRPIKQTSKVSSAFQALIAGYAMNNVIPRSGDIVRPLLFAKKEGVLVSGTVASMLIERLSDLIGLSFVTMLTLVLFHTQISIAFPAIEHAIIPIMSALVFFFFLGILILFSEEKTVRVIRFLIRPLPLKMREAIEGGTKALEEGLRGVRSGSAVPLIVGTLGIWLLYAASMYVSLYAFPQKDLPHIGFMGCIMLQTLSGLAFTIPTPGGTGTYHFFISQALTAIFGVAASTGIAYATITHASNYIITTIVGVVFMLMQGISFSEVRVSAAEKSKKEAQPVTKHLPMNASIEQSAA